MLSFLGSLLRMVFVSCPSISPGHIVGTVHDPDIAEASSLTASLHHQDLFWTINDSGNTPTVFGLNSKGDSIARLNLVGADNVDWEAVETGYCQVGGDQTCLYVADMGDNLRVRQNLTIYRVREPDTSEELMDEKDWDQVMLRYPGGEAHDAESMLIDHQDRLLLVITKGLVECRVFTTSLDFTPGTIVTLQPTDLYLVSLFATDASSSYDGNRIVIRSYLTGFLWQAPSPGASLLATLATDPCVIPVGLERQGESIALEREGSAYYTHSERVDQNIIKHEFI